MSRHRQPYTLYLRGEYWYYRTYTPEGLRTVAKSTGCKKKIDARKYCEDLYLSGKLFSTNKTFKDYAIHFYDDNSPYVKDRLIPLSDNTLRSYRSSLKQYILPYFQNKKLDEINYTALKNFRIKMLSEYSPGNVISTMSTLKHIIDSAYRDRLIAANPFSYLEPFETPQRTRDAFTLDEVCLLYRLTDNEFKNMIILMALTGMRISEACGVRTSDIKQTDSFEYIDLKQQLNHKKYINLKNKEARPIPIIQEIKNIIGFEPMRLSAFYRDFNRIKNNFSDYEQRKLCFHSLRHFFITNTKSTGLNESKIEFIAGHSLRGITKVYTNYHAEDLGEVLAWQKDLYYKITDCQ